MSDDHAIWLLRENDRLRAENKELREIVSECRGYVESCLELEPDGEDFPFHAKDPLILRIDAALELPIPGEAMKEG